MTVLRLSHVRGLTGLGLLGLLSCTDGPAGPVRGTQFVAEGLDGQALPAVVARDSSLETTLLEDRLVFLGDPRFVQRTTWRATRDLRTGAVERAGGTSRMEYRLSGDQLIVGYFGPCAPNALCTAPDTGVLLATELRLRVLGYARRTLTFRRQP